jgi:hypothetical protein
MRFKSGKGAPRIHGLRTEIVLAAVIIDQVFRENATEAVITSGIDGRHSRGSLHYQGSAMDFRTRDLLPANQKTVRDEIKLRLGEDFDVVLEKDYLHVEWQPKQPY